MCVKGTVVKKRARIDDVVQLSGVSRSTVDRVLNERPGVRPVTIEKVEKAMRELGYSPNALAFRSGSRLRQIEVLLSEGTNPFFHEIRAGMDAAVEREKRMGTKFLFRGFDPYDLSTLVDRLNNVQPETSAVIMVGADDTKITQAIDGLNAKGIRVITVISDVPLSKRAAYVGQDNFAAGRTAGRMMAELVPPGSGEVAVLIGHLRFRHLLDRQSGFQQTLGTSRPELSILPTRPYGTDPQTARQIINDVLERKDNLKGIYISGGGQPEIIRALQKAQTPDRIVIGHEVNTLTRAALYDGTFRMLVAHDVYEVGRKAMDSALELDDRSNVFCGINVYVPENLPHE